MTETFKMLSLPSPAQKNPDKEDSSGSDAGSEVGLEPETDRFGFLVTKGCTAGSVGPPPELVRQREAKWINIIVQWDRVMLKKTRKVKVQSQKGIPASLRAKCWPLLCGATDRMRQNEHLYQHLDSQSALQSWVDVIEKDLDRQFPFHEMFQSKDGHGQRGLFRVLKAYTQYRPEAGYCQAQGPVAAVLLMNMPAEEAFWCLVQISEHYLPGYYSPLLEGVLFDAAMLTWVLKKTCPQAHRHLQRHGVEPLMFATDWLMCLFTRHLPFNTLLRVWDLFFCYGVRVLLQVAVVLVSRVLGRPEQRKRCQGQLETLERLRGVREQVHDGEDSFVAAVCSVPLSDRDLEKQTERELDEWRKSRPSSTFNPRGRCRGFQMAWARARQNEEERDKVERERGNLSGPLARSASVLSLSSYVARTRWRKGGKVNAHEWEGGDRAVRHLSIGPKEAWRSSTESNFKKVAHEEDKEEHKKQTELELRGQTDHQEPKQMDNVQNIPSDRGEDTVREQTEQVETRISEKERNKTVPEQREETNVEAEPARGSSKDQTEGNICRPTEHPTRHHTSTAAEIEDEEDAETVQIDSGAETLKLCSPTCIQPEEDTDLVADVPTEAEIPVSNEATRESREATTQGSWGKYDVIASEATHDKGGSSLTANSEAQNDLTQAKETPTQTRMNGGTSDSIAPPQEEAASRQGNDVITTPGPDGKTSSAETNTSEERTPEQPKSRATAGAAAEEEEEEERTVGGDVFICTEPRDSNAGRKPRVRDGEPRLGKGKVVPSNSSSTRGSAHHCSRSSRDICIRKSSSHGGPSVGRRLSDDLFVVKHTESRANTGDAKPPQTNPDWTRSAGISASQSEEVPKRTGVQPQSSDSPKGLGLFSRVRGDRRKKTPAKAAPGAQVPQIVSHGTAREKTSVEEVEEKPSSGERRRQRRDRERREKEEERREKEEARERKRREKELEKGKERERKRAPTRGESFQVQREPGSGGEPHPVKTAAQTHRYSASYDDSYF